MNPMRLLSIAAAARVPVIFWGMPGVGKTQSIYAFARQLDLPCEVVIGSIREPVDMAGYPVLEEGVMRLAAPSWAMRLIEAGRGVLFLDELTTAPPAVQKAMLRIVLERVVGEYQLPDEVVVVAAANPPEVAAGGFLLAPPLANRFCHLEWPSNPIAWCEGMESGFSQMEGLLPILSPTQWQSHLPLKRSLIAAFIRHKPTLLQQLPKDEEQQSRAWPSRRTWDMGAHVLAVLAAHQLDHGPTEEKLQLLSGLVGDGAAQEFVTWETQLDLPDPEQILRHPERLQLPERSDLRYAVISAVCAAVASRPTIERWQAGWAVVMTVFRTGYKDLAVAGARLLLGCRPVGAKLPNELAEFLPLMRQAGLFHS